jgi:hypothetical protein
MDGIVEREYETLYRRFPDEYELRYWLDQEAEELLRSTSLRLRADARYLLLINFSEMVLRPAEQAGRVSRGEFRDVARDDIRTLIGVAADLARRLDLKEISGHQVLNAIPTIWRGLKTMAYNVWD